MAQENPTLLSQAFGTRKLSDSVIFGFFNTDKLNLVRNWSNLYQFPVAVALFPLNATFGTQEINNRTAQGIPNNVHLAPGPNGKANGSYEFLGTSDSYIEFHNTAGGPLDVRKSITMLCWLHHGGQNGPIFTYKTSSSSWGVHLVVYQGKLYVRFNKRDYSATKTETLIDTTPVARRMEVCRRILWPRFRWSEAVGWWSRGSKQNRRSRTGTSHARQHQNGNEERLSKVFQRQNHSDAGVQRIFGPGTNTDNTKTNTTW